MGRYPARELLQKIAQSTWVCGDPGMQFDTVINRWHTCKESGRINSSNPCSEYMFLDDTACNLASLNLLRFETPDGGFDAERFVHVCEVVITAQEILVDRASYPTEKIEANSHLYRPLGLGYANLGALLMRARPALRLGRGPQHRRRDHRAALRRRLPAVGPHRRRQGRLRRLRREPRLDDRRHGDAPRRRARPRRELPDVVHAARLTPGRTPSRWPPKGAGLRNSQISVLAPTGTIAFMMDCDTTGVEPDIGLVKYKMLVGGGTLKIVNHSVETALQRLGYDDGAIRSILAHIEEHDTIEGAEALDPEHLAVFDCAFKAARGTRSIHHMGHLKMLAAVQPFISGAISKTINLPEHSSVEDIAETYLEAWRLGLKAVAIYRDGCKRSQPLSLDKKDASAEAPATEATRARRAPPQAAGRAPGDHPQVRGRRPRGLHHRRSLRGRSARRDLPRHGQGRLRDLGPHGRLRDLGLDRAAVRRAAAHADPQVLARALRAFGLHVEQAHPDGQVDGRLHLPLARLEVSRARRAGSPRHPARARRLEPSLRSQRRPSRRSASEPESFVNDQDAPPCSECGSIMLRNGACYHCSNCGATSGCG